MFFWNSLAFSMIQRMLAIWSLVPLPFLKPAWTSGSLRFTHCWSLAWRMLSMTLLAFEMSAVVQQLVYSRCRSCLWFLHLLSCSGFPSSWEETSWLWGLGSCSAPTPGLISTLTDLLLILSCALLAPASGPLHRKFLSWNTVLLAPIIAVLSCRSTSLCSPSLPTLFQIALPDYSQIPF